MSIEPNRVNKQLDEAERLLKRLQESIDTARRLIAESKEILTPREPEPPAKKKE